MYSGAKDLSGQNSHTVHFGRIADGVGHTIDEALFAIFRAPKSYTGEDMVEISCHGSVYIQQAILQLCYRLGAQAAKPGEFTQRAFLNGKLDLSQAEAVADLIAAESETAHNLALRQLRGGFRHDIARLRERLIAFASLVELELDFAEEDVEFADRTALREGVTEIRTRINELAESFRLGNALRTGVATVIAGRPNAGKSTLLNALLNEERAIVSDIAGTTRDVIEAELNIKGLRFRLIDTAGIREAQDQIEAIGVSRTFEQVRQAAIVLYLWDVGGDTTIADVHADLLRLGVEADAPLLVLCNKMDKNPLFDPEWLIDPDHPETHPYLRSPAPFARAPLTHAQILTLSAKNRMNLEALRRRLFELAGGDQLRRDNPVVTNARHYEALRRADQALAEVLRGLDTGITHDFLAQDIRRSLQELGEISGEISTEDLLDNIFSKFCIGK